jgi:hypothetical protein
VEDIDLDQPARVLWWEVPIKSGWAGNDRQFGTLRSALLFVLNELKKSERHTALVLFATGPKALNFSLPGAKKAAEKLLKRNAQSPPTN